MSDSIGYLPGDIATRLRLRTSRIPDGDTAWDITRLAEAAYARGTHDGYLRGMTDEAKRAQVNEHRASSHEDTCPARPDCECHDPKEPT